MDDLDPTTKGGRLAILEHIVNEALDLEQVVGSSKVREVTRLHSSLVGLYTCVMDDLTKFLRDSI